MPRPRIGIIGLGGMGSLYYRLLRENLRIDVTSVSDVDEERLKQASVQGVKVFRDYVEMLTEGGFEGVIVATPPSLHKAPAVEALKRGYWVLLEKPMATSLRDAVEIYREARGRLMMAFTLRYNRLFRRVKEILDGDLGDPVLQWHVALGAVPGKGWIARKEISGGMLNEFGVHALYTFTWFSGDVETVYAEIKRVSPDIDIEDHIALILRHRSGFSSAYVLSWGGGHWWYRWGVEAMRGRITVEGYVTGSYVATRRDGTTVESGSYGGPADEMYVEQLRHFIECIENGLKPLTNELDGLKIQAIVEAAHRSSITGRPTKLSEVLSEAF